MNLMVRVAVVCTAAEDSYAIVFSSSAAPGVFISASHSSALSYS